MGENLWMSSIKTRLLSKKRVMEPRPTSRHLSSHHPLQGTCRTNVRRTSVLPFRLRDPGSHSIVRRAAHTLAAMPIQLLVTVSVMAVRYIAVASERRPTWSKALLSWRCARATKPHGASGCTALRHGRISRARMRPRALARSHCRTGLRSCSCAGVALPRAVPARAR